MIERHRLAPLGDQSLVEHVEHLQEGRLVADRIDAIALEVALDIRAGLTPDLEREIGQRSHL